MIRNYNELTRLEMEQVDRANTIVLIPLGATEQHGNQAPLGTDAMIAGAMPEYIKAELSKVDPDYPMLIFPVIPVGFSVEHLGFCGSISFKPDTYYHMLYDITQSLAHHGFVKIVYLICHGGNRPVVDMLARQVRADFGVLPFVLASGAFFHPDVQATISPGNTFDFHGGEMETSMVLAINPSSVKLELSTGARPGTAKRRSAFQASMHSPGWGRSLSRRMDARSASAATRAARLRKREGSSWRPAHGSWFRRLLRSGIGHNSEAVESRGQRIISCPFGSFLRAMQSKLIAEVIP